MTVNGLGKIDLNQWIYSVVLHANRHLQQMARIEAEFNVWRAGLPPGPPAA